MKKQDRTGAHLHYAICTALNIIAIEQWYTLTRTLTPGCEHEYIEVLWIQAVYIRDVRASRKYIIKSQNTHSDAYANSSRQECDAN